MISKMKSFLVMGGLVLLASACISPANRTISELNNLLDSLQVKYVPDDRIELWNITPEAEWASQYVDEIDTIVIEKSDLDESKELLIGDPNDPTTQEPFVGSGVFIY